MDTLKNITPTIAIAGQPTEAHFKTLKAQGYVGIVNLRNEGEPEQPIGPAAEEGVVQAAGLEYLHYAVGAVPLHPTGVNAVIDFLDRHKDEKVLVHCRSGGRASAILLIREAKANGWSASEAVAKGRAVGLDVKGGLQMMVEQYLSSH